MKRTELSNNALWDLVAEVLTILSNRDKVDYRVKATDESVERKVHCYIDEKEVVTILLKLEDMLTNRGVNVKSVCDS